MKTLVVITLCMTYLIYGSLAGNTELSLDINCPEVMPTVQCTFTFTNNGQEDIYVLKRNTPLEGLFSPFVRIISPQGHPLQYEGLYVFRAPITKDEFVLLPAGKSISGIVDITKAFSISSDGLYTIQYIKPVQYMTLQVMSSSSSYEDKIQETFVRETESIYLKDTHLLSRPDLLTDSNEGDKETVNVQGCNIITTNGGTAAQKATLNRVHGYLCTYIKRAANSVGNTGLYKTWFGAYTTSRAGHVKGVLSKIDTGVHSDTLTYDMNGAVCASNPGWIAYTRWGIRTTYLCPGYHSLKHEYCHNKVTGQPFNMEFVLLHEWTHAYGYTDDYGYGDSFDLNLARTNPDKAIKNADNYNRYYCPATY